MKLANLSFNSWRNRPLTSKGQKAGLSLIALLFLIFSALYSQPTKVYWSEGYKILRSNLDGSSLETVLLPGGNPLIRNVRVDISADLMYWTEYLNNRIMKANTDGTNVQVLITGLSRPEGLALDLAAGKVYWSEQPDGVSPSPNNTKSQFGWLQRRNFGYRFKTAVRNSPGPF